MEQLDRSFRLAAQHGHDLETDFLPVGDVDRVPCLGGAAAAGDRGQERGPGPGEEALGLQIQDQPRRIHLLRGLAVGQGGREKARVDHVNLDVIDRIGQQATLDLADPDPREPPGQLHQEIPLFGRDPGEHLRRRIRQRKRTIAAHLDPPAGEIGMLDRLPGDERLGGVLVKPLELLTLLFAPFVLLLRRFLVGLGGIGIGGSRPPSYRPPPPEPVSFFGSEIARARAASQGRTASDSRPRWKYIQSLNVPGSERHSISLPSPIALR